MHSAFGYMQPPHVLPEPAVIVDNLAALVVSGCSLEVHSNAKPLFIRPSISERPPEKRVSNVPKALTETLPGSAKRQESGLTTHVDEMNQVVGCAGGLFHSYFPLFSIPARLSAYFWQRKT